MCSSLPFSCPRVGTPVQCDRIYEEDGCHEVAGCEWNKLAYMCHKTGVKPACEMYYERETCLQAGCEFHHHNCFTPGDFEECSKIQSRHKVGRCTKLGKAGVGCLWWAT